MKFKSMKKMLLFTLVMTLVMIIMNLETPVRAATSYNIAKKNIVISKSGEYVITGSSNAYSITVKKGVTADITLKNVTMTNENVLNREMDLFDIKSGAVVRLVLVGKNTITNSNFGAAIHVPNGATLAIMKASTGSLTVNGGVSSAGIGASCNDVKGETGNITINGGTIYAQGGYESCGIGGGGTNRYDYTVYQGFYTGGGTITINGGKVTAIGGNDGGCAGIGGASLTRQGKIKITGGVVTASSKEAGIGGEAREGKGNIITITGGIVSAIGNNYAAGIGNNMNPAGTVISISGGTVTASGDYGNRTLYEAYVRDRKDSHDSLKAYDLAAEKIVISGGTLHADTLSKQPVDSKGNKVYQTYLNCKQGTISSITYGDISYGVKNMSSKGYLSLYLPTGFKTLTVKSGSTTLFKETYYMVNIEPLNSIKKEANLILDISQGDVELIDGGCIYLNKVYQCDNITITGTTTEYRIYVHQNSQGKQNIRFQDVKADYVDTGAEDFLIVDNDVTVEIHLQGSNYFKLGDSSRGIFVGNGASLCFTGESLKDSFICTSGSNTAVIYTNLGNVVQYGGLLEFELGSNSAAIDTGNYGTYTLCGGTFEAHNEEGSVLTGLNSLKVWIHGGTLIADTIGIKETGNEEVANHTLFTMTGGEVKVKERIMFGEYRIFGGTIETRILGCGTGADVWMFGGNLEIGTYIDYSNYILETDIRKENILGGTVNQRNDVPQEEIDQIATNRG